MLLLITSATVRGEYESFLSNIFAARFGPVGIVAGVYYLVAKFSLLLALETTNATPIWPAIGIALAAILLFTYRIWPAIRFGQFEAASCRDCSSRSCVLPRHYSQPSPKPGLGSISAGSSLQRF
jgi:hypothetical protein